MSDWTFAEMLGFHDREGRKHHLPQPDITISYGRHMRVHLCRHEDWSGWCDSRAEAWEAACRLADSISCDVPGCVGNPATKQYDPRPR